MPSHPKQNSLFTFSPQRLKVKQRKNGTFIIKTKSQSSHPVTWFTDAPARKTGQLPADYFGYHFNLLFSESKPNASLNFRKKTGDANAVFNIKKASVRHKGDVDIVSYKINPIGKKSVRTFDALTGETLDNPYLFIDNSSEQSSTPEDIVAGVGAGSAAVWAGYSAYQAYVKRIMLRQVLAHQALENPVKKTIERIFGRGEGRYVMEVYFKKVDDFIKSMDEAAPEFKSFEDLQKWITQDEFGENIVELMQGMWDEVWSEISKLDFTDPDQYQLAREAISSDVRKFAYSTWRQQDTLFYRKGWQDVAELYEAEFNLSANYVLKNPEALRRFDILAKKFEADLYQDAMDGAEDIASGIQEAFFPYDSFKSTVNAIDSTASSGIFDGPIAEVGMDLVEEELGGAVAELAPELGLEVLGTIAILA